MKKLFMTILIVLLMVLPSAFSLDLSDYPSMFSSDVRVIVGKSAAAEDVVGAIDVVAALQQRLGLNNRIQGAMLDTEVSDLESMNSIVIGGPCINSAAAKLMKYPKNCLDGFEVGKGFIRLYDFSNGNIALLAAGTTALDTRRVTTVLANYRDYGLNGTEMEIAGLNMNDVNVDIK